MKIIIAGDGKVGGTLARKLSAEGYDITLIDSNARVLDASLERYDVMVVHGNCTLMSVLSEADVERANLLIAATSADEINLLCCMTAHKMNPDLHTIARIRNPEYSEQIYKMRDAFGLSLTVNPEKQTAVEIERLLKYPVFLQRDTFAKGRVELVELRIDEDSILKDVSLNDLYSIVKCQVLVCAVRRNGQVETPDGNFVLKEGDRIYVTAPSDNLTIMLKNMGLITHKVRRVILCGGGKVSYYLAKILRKSGISVEIIEENEERARRLAELLPSVDIIHGDASRRTLLESQGIEDCDALITLTGMDELNIIISMYAKTCGVPHVITKVGHTDRSSIQDSLHLGSIVCPKDLCCDTIVGYVRALEAQTGAAISVHNIADGQVEAVEFRVDEKTKHCGKPLKEISIKNNMLIACITHKGKTEIPNGDSYFENGDTVIVVSKGDVALHQLNDIFQ
ncbi:MAG: Trk system potassium transporter TrkA [Eubacterium sp.]|nr:Trk system potassium transporter TrkA [Eubacterium sp.]